MMLGDARLAAQFADQMLGEWAAGANILIEKWRFSGDRKVWK